MAKTVLITGCSDGGIGSTLAQHYAKAGCRVFATARKLSSMSELVDNESVSLFALDVSDSESIRRCHAEIRAASSGRLDILVNNAGLAYSGAGIEMNIEKCREIFDVNVFGVMEMNKTFGPMLVESKGTICSTGSIAALVPVPFGGIYNTSKAALAMYNDCLRMELEPLGVKVVNFVTGQVQSNIVSNSAHRFELTKDSYYLPIEDDINRVRASSQGNRSLDRDVYAASVVRQSLLENPPPRIYKGGLSTIVWILSTFLPYSVISFITSRRSGLHRLGSIRSKKTI